MLALKCLSLEQKAILSTAGLVSWGTSAWRSYTKKITGYKDKCLYGEKSVRPLDAHVVNQRQENTVHVNL